MLEARDFSAGFMVGIGFLDPMDVKLKKPWNRGTGLGFPTQTILEFSELDTARLGLSPVGGAGDVELLFSKLEFTTGNMEKPDPAVQSRRGGARGRSHLAQGMDEHRESPGDRLDAVLDVLEQWEIPGSRASLEYPAWSRTAVTPKPR